MGQWKAFIGGVTVTLGLIAGAYLIWSEGGTQQNPAIMTVPPGTVIIKPLPPLLTLGGSVVPFEGKKEIPLPLAGQLARELVIVSFQAAGENSHRSAVKIVWEDGSVELVPAGISERKFAPERRARQISILGYSFHERRVLHDLPQKGTLSWEIRYAPVTN